MKMTVRETSDSPQRDGSAHGRIAVIVGIGGIGGAIAERLAASGAKIYGTYFSDSGRAAELADRLPEGTWLGASALDVADREDVSRVLTRGEGAVFSTLGHVDTLVVTAGHRHELGMFHEQDPGMGEAIVRTELLGPMNVVREYLRAQDAARPRRIVLIGSDSGKAGTFGDAASSASRAGLVGFAKSIARETAQGDTTINVVNPGPTQTAMLNTMLDSPSMTGKVMNGTVRAIPKKRLALPEEIAETVAYLTGRHSGFITGQVISVSGGLTMG